MIRKSRKMVLFLFLMFCVSTLFVPSFLSAAGTHKKVCHYEGITEYLMDNGLRVVLIPDSTKETVTVNITYLVGSRHEIYGQTGMAHLLEHMVFKGTKNFPDFRAQARTRGASYNGSTWFDRTNYFETLPAKDGNLEWALKFETDRMRNAVLTEKKLTPERTVVVNELDMGDNSATGVLWDKIEAMSYMYHGYGHSTIGSKSDLQNVPLAAVKAFYDKYYQPDNAILIISGKIDEKKTLALVHKHMGKIPRPKRKLIPTYTREASRDSYREIKLRRVSEIGAVGMTFHTPSAGHPDTAALKILESVMTDEPSGRLYKALVVSKKAASLYPRSYLRKEGGMVSYFATVPKGKSVDAVRDIMIKVTGELEKNPVTKKEVERAKNQLSKRLDMLLSNSQRFNTRLSEWASRGDWRLFFVYRDGIKNVTVKDVMRVAAHYFRPENQTVGILLPTAKPTRVDIPEVKDLNAILKNYNKKEVKAEKKTFELTIANLEKHTQRVKLPNGMKLALLSKPSRGGKVEMRITIPLCNAKDLVNGKRWINNYVADMLMRGTKKHTREQIKDELGKLKADVRFFGTTNSTSITIRTTQENVMPVCRLVAEILKEPVFDGKEFETAKQESITRLQQLKTEPMMVAIQEMMTYLLPKSHPLYQGTSDEQIDFVKTLDTQTIRQFYDDYYGMDVARLAAVGEFDLNKIEDFCKKEFSTWKSKKKAELIPRNFPGHRPGINKAIETPGKTNSMIILGTNFQMDYKHPEKPAMIMVNYLLGGKGLTARFGDRIRTKEGLSYMVQSIFQAPSQGDNSFFGAIAISAAKNAKKAEKCFFEEIEKASTKGFTAEELEDGKKAWLAGRTRGLSSERALVAQLSGQLERNETFKNREVEEADMKKVTLDQLNAVMKKYIKAKNISVVMAGDFAAAKKELEKEKADKSKKTGKPAKAAPKKKK